MVDKDIPQDIIMAYEELCAVREDRAEEAARRLVLVYFLEFAAESGWIFPEYERRIQLRPII